MNMRNRFPTVLLSASFLLGLLGAACPFGQSDSSDLRPLGPTIKADFLIYFNRDLSQDEINTFTKSILSRPHPEGRGDDLAPGVRTRLRIRDVEGHPGIAITFFANATDKQRHDLFKSIKASPQVYKVLENTTPDSVKTLK